MDEGVLDLGGLTWWDAVWAAVILLAAWLGGRLIGSLLWRGLARAGMPDYAARILGRFLRYGIVLLGVYYALVRLGVAITPLLGLVGVLGLAFALAFQDIAGNFVSGLVLLARRPFVPGDEIASNGEEGTVEDVNLRAVVLRSYDGRRVFLPSGDVLGSPIVNHTVNGIRRSSVEVGVSYGSDLDRARSVIDAAVRGAEGVAAEPAPRVFATGFGASSIDLVAHVWHAPDAATTWTVRDRTVRAIKAALDEAGIEIPFPQRVIWTAGEADHALP